MIELQQSLNITQIGKKHVETINAVLNLLKQRDCQTAIEAITVLSFCIAYTLERFKIPKESFFQIQEASIKALKEVFNFKS